jgi:hypothetical protein
MKKYIISIITIVILISALFSQTADKKYYFAVGTDIIQGYSTSFALGHLPSNLELNVNFNGSSIFDNQSENDYYDYNIVGYDTVYADLDTTYIPIIESEKIDIDNGILDDIRTYFSFYVNRFSKSASINNLKYFYGLGAGYDYIEMTRESFTLYYSSQRKYVNYDENFDYFLYLQFGVNYEYFIKDNISLDFRYSVGLQYTTKTDINHDKDYILDDVTNEYYLEGANYSKQTYQSISFDAKNNAKLRLRVYF